MSNIARIVFAALALVLAGCTGMGQHHANVREKIDFGPPETLSICLYVDKGISEESGRNLVESAWKEQAAYYGINIKVAKVTQWERPAFAMEGILAELRNEPLEAPCDRIFALIGRNVGDFLWSFVGPEVLGAVNSESLTHGYAVARRASIMQLVQSPHEVVEHELYHLLGCGEHANMTACYSRIAELKRWKQETGADFFPSWDLVNNRMMVSRLDVNARLEPFSDRRLAQNK